jgi:hypothetical protein
LASGLLISGVSPAACQKNGRSDRKRNFKKANIEYRIMNIECRRKEFYRLQKIQKIERSDSILRNSLFDILRFCGSLFSPAAGLESDQFNHQETVLFWRNFIQGVGCQGKEMLDTET